MKLTGRVINGGKVTAQAVVLDSAFAFIGQFDPAMGTLVFEGHPLHGCSLAGKVLVCTTGKGGTIAPFIAYQANQEGKAPAAILCDHADPILTECALVIDIPILDTFDQEPTKAIRTGQTVAINGETVTVE